MEKPREILIAGIEHTLDCLTSNIVDKLQNQASRKSDGDKLVVAIGGYTALGKETLARSLVDGLGNSVILPTDSFMPDRSTKRRLGLTGDEPDAINFALLIRILGNLLENRPAEIRPYDHTSGTYQEPVLLVPSKFIIISGTASLYPPLQDFLDTSFFMYAGEETLYRLAKGVYTAERNYSESDFEKFWDIYKNSCRLFIDPTIERARAIIHITSNRRYKSELIKSCTGCSLYL